MMGQFLGHPVFPSPAPLERASPEVPKREFLWDPFPGKCPELSALTSAGRISNHPSAKHQARTAVLEVTLWLRGRQGWGEAVVPG